MKTLIYTFLILSYSIIAFANETPLIEGSVGTGNIQFYTEDDVAIEKENLHIAFYPNKSVVHVEYVMKNYGDSKSIKVGFPHRYITESGTETVSKLKNVSIKKNGESLDYIIEKETDMISKEEFTKILHEDLWYLFDYQKVWTTEYLIFDLNISSGESIIVDIGYEAENLLIKLESWGYMPMYTFTPYQFEYILTTGKNWKDGMIKDFKATIEFNDINITVLSSTVNMIELIPDKFSKTYEPGIFIWKETNFNPDENIVIKFFPPHTDFFFNKDARFVYYLTENDYEIPSEIAEGSGVRLYSIPFYFEREFYITSVKIENSDIKELDIYFEIINPVSGKDSIIKISFDQIKRSYDFRDKKISSNLFGIPKKYLPVSPEDLEIKLEYYIRILH